VEISPEVENWYATLKSKDKAMADRAFDRLADLGPAFRMPHARPLGSGLFELRFTCEGTAPGDVLHRHSHEDHHTDDLPQQRQAERQEVARARQAMRTSQERGDCDG